MDTTIRLPNPTLRPGHELFRNINDRVRDLVDTYDEEGLFVCECVDEGCAAVVRMSGWEYDVLCCDPGCHAVIPGHESREIDTVVSRSGRYVIVRIQEAARVPDEDEHREELRPPLKSKLISAMRRRSNS